MKRLTLTDDPAVIVAALRDFAPPADEVRSTVTAIVAEVRAHGDDAVSAYSRRFDKVDLPSDYRVPAAVMQQALADTAPPLRAALELAAANIRAYHEREAPRRWRQTLAQGQVVGQEVVPMRVAGLYVPGGLANYPSSVLMTAIPAQVAGCERIVVCSPPRQGEGVPGGGDVTTGGAGDGAAAGVATGVAAACALLGITDLYPIGGAQAVAAMACGTAVVPRCDVIVGPGNAYVTEAKRQFMGEVAIDSLAGPSEVLIVADAAGNPDWLAADLLAQAEHGAGAMGVLVDIGGELGERVADAVAALAAELNISHDNIAVVAVPDSAAAVAIVNAFAPEHLELHLDAAAELVPQIRNAGVIFVGPYAATAFADYAAGSNHVLPTGGCARFAQGLSVVHFQKRIGVVELDSAAAQALAPHVTIIAEAEGLRSHARSATLRME